jgi:hypothetical protein
MKSTSFSLIANRGVHALAHLRKHDPGNDRYVAGSLAKKSSTSWLGVIERGGPKLPCVCCSSSVQFATRRLPDARPKENIPI